ncbi:ABC transporter ATP-binding protein [Alkalicoccus urumqiensis]|uniref:Carnitine transport ATP-binding protein OpuCA n=1 Tax=Alkalicoccus urumqiensis TaxID=1548213 RepID=A0A2P6ML56_ALKUR|nr:ABC transporter ATP-binding protein [Alkalicoccus urumqiensis]PRO67012.1 ABC transporter [Alkalicoccus urumqiensis]
MHVQISDLEFSYGRSSEAVVQDFQLHMQEGEIVSILGESGSGKSTILRLIAGLEHPSKGRVLVGGDTYVDQTKGYGLPVEKRGLGMVFQDYALFPHMTVEANILYGLKKWKRADRYARLQEMLDLVNMLDYKKRYPHELSGGQQQRIALARALAPKPSLLLLDEPFSNLDAHLQQRIRDELRETIKHTGTTTIFVTHDQEDARVLADRVVLVEEGTVQNIGRPCDLLKESLRQRDTETVRA